MNNFSESRARTERSECITQINRLKKVKMNRKLKHKDITEKIIGTSFEVHKFLGNELKNLCNHLIYLIRDSDKKKINLKQKHHVHKQTYTRRLLRLTGLKKSYKSWKSYENPGSKQK
jgi:hypothetical protein